MHSLILAAGHGSVMSDIKGILNWASHSVFIIATVVILVVLTLRTEAKGWHVIAAAIMGAFAAINIPSVSEWVHKVDSSGSAIGSIGVNLGLLAFLVGMFFFVIITSRNS